MMSHFPQKGELASLFVSWFKSFETWIRPPLFENYKFGTDWRYDCEERNTLKKMNRLEVGNWNRDGQNPESDWSRSMMFFVGFGMRFLLICWSRSLVSNFKIEIKNDASVKCDSDVITLVSHWDGVSAKIFETETRRDLNVPRRDTRRLKLHIYKTSRVFLTLNFGQWTFWWISEHFVILLPSLFATNL